MKKNQEPKPKDVGELAGSTGSGQPSQSQESETSDLDAIVEAVVARVEPGLEELSKKFFQSQKDKGVASAVDAASEALDRIEAIEGPVKRVLELMQQRGLTQEQALDEVNRDLRLERLESQLSSQPEPTSTTTEPAPDKAAFDWRERRERILQDSGISKRDPAYLEFVRSRNWDLDNPDEFVKALDAWAFQRETKPVATGASGSNTSQGVGKQDEPDLQERYDAEMAELRRQSPGDALAISKIRKKYRDQGLDI